MIQPAFDGALYSALKQFPKKPKSEDLKKEWYVYFDYRHADTWQPVRRKGGINEEKNFKEKVKSLHALKETLQEQLDRGWNPLTKTYRQKDTTVSAVYNEHLSFSEAMDFGLEKCDVAKSTVKDYSVCIRQVKKAAIVLRLHTFPVRKLEQTEILLVLDKAARLFDWSAKNYNKKLGYLQAVLTQLVDWKILKYNPAHKIKTKTVTDSAPKYVPYTEAEKKKIADYLFLNHYGFYVYSMTRYYTGMRPVEVLAMKIKDIDFRSTMITIVPDRQRQNSKTKKLREVQINKHLLPILREWTKDEKNREAYVFGSPFVAGQGNRGSVKGRKKDGAMHPDYFKPSCTRIKRDTTTKLWKKVVMDGLGINKHQYAAKHTATDDMLMAGISMEAIKEMFGHTEEFMTKRYQTVLKKLRRAEINEKSVPFVQ